MDRFGSIEAFRQLKRPVGKQVYLPRKVRVVESHLPSTYITMYGNKLETSKADGTKRTVRCSYGIMNVLQLRHISALKQHYRSTIPRGRYRRGTPRVGETELLSALMQNLKTCTKKAVVSTDLSYVTICSDYKSIAPFYECMSPKPDTTVVKVRYSAVLANVF